MLKVALFLSGGLIAGCSHFIGRQAPAPVYTYTQQVEKPAVKLSLINLPNKFKLVQKNKPIIVVQEQPEIILAIQQLLADAELSYQQGKLDIAVMTLERALRIAPRRAILFYKLAALKMHQGEFMQVENLAKKSALLATGDYPLKKQNWLLIAAAREQLGLVEKADRARQKAKTY